MKFQAVKNEICKRLGDLKNQTFIAVAGEYFVQALSNIVAGDDFTPEEVPELVTEKDEQVNRESGYGEINITDKGFLRVYNVIANPQKNGGREIITKWITPQRAEQIKVSSVLKPAIDEIYVYKENTVIKVISSIRQTKRLFVTITNIKYPQSTDWAEQDLTADLHYSPRIIDNAISEAVRMIRGDNATK